MKLKGVLRPRLVAAVVASALAAASFVPLPAAQGMPSLSGPSVAGLGEDEPTPARLASDVQFRRSLGFPADEAYIRALYSAADAGALPGADFHLGTLFNAVEAAEVAVREQLSAGMETLKQYVDSHPDPTFAGLWLDHAAGGIVTVAFTDDVVGHDLALRPLVTRPERFRVVGAKHTLAELDAVHAAVAAASNQLAAEGVTIHNISTDVAHNRVQVGVGSDVEAARAVLASRHPGMTFSVVAAAEPQKKDKSFNTDAPPARGGQFLMRTSNEVGYVWTCTSAFVGYTAYRLGPPYPTYVEQIFVITAGHCGPKWSVWAQNTYALGHMERSYDISGPSTDYASILIKNSDKSNQVQRFLHDYQSITASEGRLSGSDQAGQFVCQAGYSSTYACGTIVSNNFTARYSDGQVVTNMREASFISLGGDSGGSIFYNSLAKGILSGGAVYSDGHETTYYAHISYAIEGLGLTGLVLS